MTCARRLTAASGYCELLTEAQMGSAQRQPAGVAQSDATQLAEAEPDGFGDGSNSLPGASLERKYELKRADIEGSIQRSIDEIEFFAIGKEIC